MTTQFMVPETSGFYTNFGPVVSILLAMSLLELLRKSINNTQNRVSMHTQFERK
jgi:hypothetical protein